MSKSAREMFEELGYYYRYIKGDCSEDVIQYQDFGRTVLRKEDLAKYIIQFNLVSKYIVATNLTFINMKLLQAINQQVKDIFLEIIEILDKMIELDGEMTNIEN